MGYDGRMPERRIRSGQKMPPGWLEQVLEVVWLAAEEPRSVCVWPTEKGESVPVCARCHLLLPLMRRLVQGRKVWEPRGEG